VSRPNFNCVAIIGVGLIGGSFGMALKKHRLAGSVIGIGRNPDRLQRAVELGAIDRWSLDASAGVRGADLIYIATPVGLELDFVQRVLPSAKPGCIITDAGSTKAEICRGADVLVKDRAAFVGGHPMAGSEAAGVEAARADLFEDTTYVLTPTVHTDSEALEKMHHIVEGIGARPLAMDPEIHDRCAAVISHLPHVIAAGLTLLAQEESAANPQVLELVAGSFRDMTRVAGSPPVLWRDICLTNTKAIKDAVDEFRRLIDQAVALMEGGDAQALEDWFGAAKIVRDTRLPPDDRGA